MSEETAELPEWHPIETAPKDGSEVILAVKMRAGISHGVLVGHYMGGGHCIEDHPPIDAGWYFWNGCMFDKASAPTHWMPMPHHPEWKSGSWQERKQASGFRASLASARPSVPQEPVAFIHRGTFSWKVLVLDTVAWDKLPHGSKLYAAPQEPQPASVEPADPMDTPLPCDVTIGGGTHRKGTKFSTLIARMRMLHEAAFGPMPSPEEAERNLATLQGHGAEPSGERSAAADGASADARDAARPPAYMLAKLAMVMPLFQEVRDALPVLTEQQRKVHGISPTLADRMDAAGTYSLDDWNAAMSQQKESP